MARGSSNLFAIELQDSQVKIVHAARSSGRMVVQQLIRKPLGKDADDGIAQLLKSLRRQAKGSLQLYGVVPSKQFISKNVDIPSNDPAEIAKIIDLQVGRMTPYSRDEIVVDYLAREIPDQHYTSVLLVIIQRKIIDRYYAIAQKAGLPLEDIVVASEGMGLVYAAIDGLGQGSEAYGGIHITADATDLAIMNGEEVVFIRSIPIGRRQFQESQEAALAEFINELSKSVTAYQDLGVGSPVKTLVVTGLTEGLEFLEQAIPKSCLWLQNEEVVVKMVPYAEIFNTTDAAQTSLAAEKQDSFFELLSCSLNEPSLRMDLSPKEIKMRRRIQESSRDAINMGILVMGCFLLISLFLGSKIYFKSEMARKLDDINTQTYGRAKTLQSISNKGRMVRTLLETRGKGLKIFDRVTQLIGPDLYLSELSYDQEGKLGFAGTAESMSKVFAFVTTLEESNYFSSVKTIETKSRRQGKLDVADFIIECMLAEGF